MTLISVLFWALVAVQIAFELCMFLLKFRSPACKLKANRLFDQFCLTIIGFICSMILYLTALHVNERPWDDKNMLLMLHIVVGAGIGFFLCFNMLSFGRYIALKIKDISMAAANALGKNAGASGDGSQGKA